MLHGCTVISGDNPTPEVTPNICQHESSVITDDSGGETGMKVYGIAELAEALGVARNTVAQWHRRGKLPEADQVLAMGPIWFAPTVHRWLREQAAVSEETRWVDKRVDGRTAREVAGWADGQIAGWTGRQAGAWTGREVNQRAAKPVATRVDGGGAGRSPACG